MAMMPARAPGQLKGSGRTFVDADVDADADAEYSDAIDLQF
jgi:hypothetical protein